MLDKVDWLGIVSHCKTTGLSYSSWSEIVPITHIIQQMLSTEEFRTVCMWDECSFNNHQQWRFIKSAIYFLLLLSASRTFLLSLLQWHCPSFRHPYYCPGIMLTHRTCLLVAHSYAGGWAAHPPESLCLSISTYPTTALWILWFSRWTGISVQFPHKKVKREKSKYQSLDRWRQRNAQVKFHVPKQSIFIITRHPPS